MTKPELPVRKTLAQENDDFTAEGSPPPGKVAKASPARPGKAVKRVARLPLMVPGAPRGAPSVGKR